MPSRDVYQCVQDEDSFAEQIKALNFYDSILEELLHTKEKKHGTWSAEDKLMAEHVYLQSNKIRGRIFSMWMAISRERSGQHYLQPFQWSTFLELKGELIKKESI